MSGPNPRHTMLEADDEAARVQAELRRQAMGKNTKDASAKEAAESDQVLFRPSKRFPLAVLTVFDDGKRTGEVIRIRSEQFIIGRSEGDLQLMDDAMVSSRHLAIAKRKANGNYSLTISDLQSRNGLFVKISKAPLVDKTEVLIGGGHYQFQAAEGEDGASDDHHDSNAPPQTMAFAPSEQDTAACFTELVPGGVGNRLVLTEQEHWVGRNANCDVRRASDQFTADRHAVIRMSSSGRWTIENNKTLNGIWLRMPQVKLEPGHNCEFRIGEQLFHLKFGG